MWKDNDFWYRHKKFSKYNRFYIKKLRETTYVNIKELFFDINMFELLIDNQDLINNFILFYIKSNFYIYYNILKKYFSFFIYYDINYFCLYLNNIKFIGNLLYYLKQSSFFLFKLLTDLTIVDNLNSQWKKRFKIVYNLFSFKFKFRLLLNSFININEPIYSMIFLYRNANWLERELWDMFGIFFINHPDLRRILTDYGFKWFPLRKDFPVSGYTEVWYDEHLQDITFKPIKLMQEMRFYHLISPWSHLL